MGKRWIVKGGESGERPEIYHALARVVDKRFAFEAVDKEQFRKITSDTNNQEICLMLSFETGNSMYGQTMDCQRRRVG